MSDLADDAARLVADMRTLGAEFHLHDGALRSRTWTYTAPDTAAKACREILACRQTWRIGFHDALCDAIDRAQTHA